MGPCACTHVCARVPIRASDRLIVRLCRRACAHMRVRMCVSNSVGACVRTLVLGKHIWSRRTFSSCCFESGAEYDGNRLSHVLQLRKLITSASPKGHIMFQLYLIGNWRAQPFSYSMITRQLIPIFSAPEPWTRARKSSPKVERVRESTHHCTTLPHCNGICRHTIPKLHWSARNVPFPM